MSRLSIAASHLSIEGVKQKMKTAPNFWQRQKWLVIYNALVDPRPAAEIAQHAGVSVGTVHRVISKYNRKGVEAIETQGKGGRRNCYLTWSEEKDFLATFFKKAAKGQIPTVKEIQLAF
ncbi:MAG: winged helix-turn-helix transcriptional regulator [Moorea sp. SIO4G3]|nr:winged helix-turn-helix transcriptional regulator [Moorena sp. SIO4G3]